MQPLVSKTCKLLVVGDRGVGKTAIVHRFTNCEFRVDFQATVGADFSAAWIDIDGDTINLQIWDTAGEERHDALAPRFYRGADGCLLVFAISDMASFNNLEKWRRHVIDYGAIDEPEKFPFIVFANKCDITEGAISIKQARADLEQQHMILVEVSAMTGQNIGEGFETLSRRFLEWRRNTGRSSLLPRIPPPVEIPPRHENKSCC
jgi:Ras-related protein Rab-7A